MLGRIWGMEIEQWVRSYLESWPQRNGVIDRHRLASESSAWVDSLPDRFREELHGVAQGSGVALGVIAQSLYAERCVCESCSGLICNIDGKTWVARNNDLWAPELWGGITLHEVDGCIPRLGFGVKADTFTTTGINREGLWLHYNHLAVDDIAQSSGNAVDSFVFLSEALETCCSIADVETKLACTNRIGGMILFAVDGKNNESALYECTCNTHFRVTQSGSWTVAANHRNGANARDRLSPSEASSMARAARMDSLLRSRSAGDVSGSASEQLRQIMAADGVEQRDPDRCTVFSTVACPSTRELWFASGDGPAASTGIWKTVPWPW